MTCVPDVAPNVEVPPPLIATVTGTVKLPKYCLLVLENDPANPVRFKLLICPVVVNDTMSPPAVTLKFITFDSVEPAVFPLVMVRVPTEPE